MAVQSTGLRQTLLGTNNFKTAFNLGFLLLYSGTVPADADSALSGNTLLAQITKDGDGVTGLTFATPSGATITKTSAEVWRDTSVVGGTVSFYRLITAAEWTAESSGGPASTTYERVQGTCGTSGADLNFTSIVLTGGAAQDISAFSVTLKL